MDNQSCALAAACMSVTLATAWAPSASGDLVTQVVVSSQMNATVTHAVVLVASIGLGSGSNSSGGAITEATLGWNPPLTALPGVGITPDTGDSYAMVGLSEGSGAPSLVVTWNSRTFSIGAPLTSFFPGLDEAQLIDGLLLNNGAGEAFLRTNFALLLTPLGSSAQAVSFSGAADFGTLTISLVTVPSPTSLALLPLGYIASLRRKRRV